MIENQYPADPSARKMIEKEGAEARKAGERSSACPYDIGRHENGWWHHGWASAGKQPEEGPKENPETTERNAKALAEELDWIAKNPKRCDCCGHLEAFHHEASGHYADEEDYCLVGECRCHRAIPEG